MQILHIFASFQIIDVNKKSCAQRFLAFLVTNRTISRQACIKF